MTTKNIFTLVSIILLRISCYAQPWQADLGNDRYKNPIIHADYSDPDVCRVGDDFYMTASSFNCSPSLPVLHSTDMINWELIGYALDKQIPLDFFDKAQHGCGVWAPAIRFHNHEFYIYYPDPDFGIYMIKAKDAKGPWSEPVLVQGGKGWIDPCPLWDEDGKAYLTYAFAGSRAGIKTILMVSEMTPDGTKLVGNSVMVFDGHDGHTTVEGPKFYKRGGYYYILAPAGGVKPGWQLALSSKNVFGPYEYKVVLHQGNTDINGPHQGALIELDNGESWFYHFQDAYAYGRIVHLQPVTWVDGWPIMGIDRNGDGIGEPVSEFRKPTVASIGKAGIIPASDEFDGHEFGLQWQWHANPEVNWGYMSGNLGFMRLNCIAPETRVNNLWEVPNLFLQKFPSRVFSATAKLRFSAHGEGDKTGLLIMGESYAYIGLEHVDGKLKLRQMTCIDSHKGTEEKEQASVDIGQNEIYLKVEVDKNAICTFSYSENGKMFKKLGNEFEAVAGRWIGAKVGLFALGAKKTNDAGYADFDWFRVE
ncbi:glycoside hydrolase family 43 protein [Gaoshiqia sp. Z1-71]|uniref:glycoside hydrolase family 43 protein n=1 Tax=Gaoshiqia hydrogeniformans TaxID=3290090 RepID=UPI003BF78AEE